MNSTMDTGMVYVALWADRHTDPTATVFATAEAAIAWARTTSREYDRHGELDETLTEAMRRDGWLYHSRYSCEGDRIWVTKCEVR